MQMTLQELFPENFGFPCQAFSIAGKRGGFADTRGTLFFEVMRLAKERKPKILFAENVKGLLNHDGGRTFGTIIRAMDELGYDVEWQLLNSANFGVPQNRERVFIIGHLRGAGGRKVFPFGDRTKEIDGIQGQNVGTITTRTGESNSVGSYVVESEQHTQKSKRVKQIIGGSQGNRLCIYQRPRGYNPGGCKDVCPTISSNNWQENNYLVNNFKIRKLTPRECFRLQGFPDEYFERAAKVNSDSQLYKQAGNSVTVNVIYEIARRL